MRLFVIVLAVLLPLSFHFSISEVLQTFSNCKEFFYQDQPPVIPGILDSHAKNNQYKIICQKRQNRYTFATFYNTENKIAVFSAYKFTGQNVPRPRISGMVEPQLDPPDDDMTVPYPNQAVGDDYNNNENVNAGHLFPCCHASDEVTAESTFTLTNIVPQKISFNEGSWNRMEIETKDFMNVNCKDNNKNVLAHVLTGAIPGNSKLKGKVNIPSYMWMAFCCYNSKIKDLVSQAYWAPNVEEDVNKNKIIEKKSLEELQKFLSEQLTKSKAKVQLFNNNCAKK